MCCIIFYNVLKKSILQFQERGNENVKNKAGRKKIQSIPLPKEKKKKDKNGSYLKLFLKILFILLNVKSSGHPMVTTNSAQYLLLCSQSLPCRKQIHVLKTLFIENFPQQQKSSLYPVAIENRILVSPDGNTLSPRYAISHRDNCTIGQLQPLHALLLMELALGIII